jgi:hypothetical protein
MYEPQDQEIYQDDQEAAAEPEPEPTPEIETSGSEVADAAAIFRLRIDAVSLGAWANAPEGGRMRTGRLRLTLAEVLKGRLGQNPGEAFEMEITQRGGAILQDPGVWTPVELAPGSELVAFTRGESSDVKGLLTDENCIRLAPAREVLDDTRAAMLIENRNPPPEMVLTAAAGSAERFGGVFARYVWTRIKNFVLGSQTSLDSYLRLVENPKTRPDARDVYLSNLYEDLGMISRPPRESEIKLAQTMLRLLVLPEAAPLYPAIGVYLPNLLRLDAKTPKYTAAEVLNPLGLDRVTLQKNVNAIAAEEERAKKLAAWLAN